MDFVVAVDGPAGTGKGTIAKLIAQELGLINIDTGAIYRCIALQAIKKGINSIENKEKMIEIAKEANIEIENRESNQETFLNGENVTSKIRSKEVTEFVSPVSSIAEIREIMVDLQRKIAKGKDVIMEGRDITTVVFPKAQVKIYLDADIEERARRRFKENQQKGILMTYEETLESIRMRDCNDMHKKVGALKIAEDAIVIDTTQMTIEEVKEKVKNIILERRK